MKAPSSGPALPSARIDFITVNYRATETTRTLVRSLAALDGAAACSVIVADNDSTAESELGLRALAAEFPGRLIVLPQSDNLWYWGGAAAAIAASYPHPAAMPDWLVVCNNDIVISDPTFLTALLDLRGRGYGVVAPRIVSRRTGSDQNPFLVRPRSFVQRLQWHVFYTHYWVARLLLPLASLLTAVRLRHRRRAGAAAQAHGDREEHIYAAHGACVVFSRLFFEQGGRLDTSVPMYAEELTTAGIAGRLGLATVHCPRLQVTHDEHATSGSILTRQKYAMQRQAFYHYLTTYGTRPAR